MADTVLLSAKDIRKALKRVSHELVEAHADTSGLLLIGILRRGVPLDGASSDHAPFREAGVPVLFILADDLSRVNSPRDSIEFVNPNRMGETVAVILNAIDALSNRR